MTQVHLELHLPDVPRTFGKKRLEVEFEGETVADLLDHLLGRYGPGIREAMYDADGVLDPVIQFVVNGKAWVRHDQLDTRLEDGDAITILALLAGG